MILGLAKSFLLRAMTRRLPVSRGWRSWFAEDNGICRDIKIKRENIKFVMIWDFCRGRKRTNTRIANFNNEVCELEAITNGASCSSHVTREPVDASSTLVESHLSQSLLHYPSHSSHHLSLSHMFVNLDGKDKIGKHKLKHKRKELKSYKFSFGLFVSL